MIKIYSNLNHIYSGDVNLDGFVAEVGSRGNYETCSSTCTKVSETEFQIFCSNYRLLSGDTIMLSKHLLPSDGFRLWIDEIKVYGEKKLSTVSIVLIVIATSAIIILGAFIFWRRRRAKRQRDRHMNRRTDGHRRPHAPSQPFDSVEVQVGPRRTDWYRITQPGTDPERERWVRYDLGEGERPAQEVTTTYEFEDQVRDRGQVEIPADSEISNLAPPAYTDSVNVHREDVVPSYEEVMTNLDSFSVANS